MNELRIVNRGIDTLVVKRHSLLDGPFRHGRRKGLAEADPRTVKDKSVVVFSLFFRYY